MGIDNEEEEQRKVTKKHYKGVDCSVSNRQAMTAMSSSPLIPFHSKRGEGDDG